MSYVFSTEKVGSVKLQNFHNQYSAFYSTFISPDGAAVEKIEAARIVSTQEEVLYSD